MAFSTSGGSSLDCKLTREVSSLTRVFFRVVVSSDIGTLTDQDSEVTVSMYLE